MAQQPRGRPPSQAPPSAGRGRNALTALGGGVLVLAVAGGAWVLFGRPNKTNTSAIGSTVSTSAPTVPVYGPKAPGAVGTTPKAKAPSPTSLGPVAANTTGPIGPTRPAATTTPKAAPTKAAVGTSPKPAVTAPAAAPTTPAPVPSKPAVVTPPVQAPQQAGTVGKAAYTFRIARGDTLWSVTKSALAKRGRSTSNANVATYVHKMYVSNRGVIGSNPNLIVPGQTIAWPAGM